MVIRLATRGDVPAMVDLEARNYVGNQTTAQQADGFVSILHSQEWFDSTVGSGGLHVAVNNDGEPSPPGQPMRTTRRTSTHATPASRNRPFAGAFWPKRSTLEPPRCHVPPEHPHAAPLS